MRKIIDFVYWAVGVLFITAIAVILIFYAVFSDEDLGPFGLFYLAGLSVIFWCFMIGVVIWILRRAYLTFRKD